MRKSLRKAIASLLAVALIVGTWSNGSVTAFATEDGAMPVAEIETQEIVVKVDDQTFTYNGESHKADFSVTGANKKNDNFVEFEIGDMQYRFRVNVDKVTDVGTYILTPTISDFREKGKKGGWRDSNYPLSAISLQAGTVTVAQATHKVDFFVENPDRGLLEGEYIEVGSGSITGQLVTPHDAGGFFGNEIIRFGEFSKIGDNYTIVYPASYPEIKVGKTTYTYDPAKNRANTYSIVWTNVKAVKEFMSEYSYHCNGTVVLQKENIYDVAFSVAQPDGSFAVVSAESKAEGSALAAPTVAEVIEANGSKYVFAGWYADAAFTTPATIGTLSADSNYYGKYVEVQTLTLEPVVEAVTYDAKAHVVNSFKTTQFGDVTVSGLSVYAEGTNAGSYDVAVEGTAVVTDANGNDVTKFYNVVVADADLVIAKKNATISSLPATKEYDGTPLTNDDFFLEGFVGGETPEVVVTGSLTDIGTAANTFRVIYGEGINAENYNVTLVEGQLSVTAIEGLVVTFDNLTHTYDGKALVGTYRSNMDLVKGHSLVIDAPSITNVGTVANTAAVKIVDAAGTDVTKYYANIQVVPGTLTVAPIDGLVVTFSNLTETYDGKTYIGEYTANMDLVAGHSFDIDLPSIKDAGTVANVADVKIVDAAGNDMTANYNVTVVPGTLTVNKRQATIKINSDSKTYDGTALTNGRYGFFDPFLSNETPKVVITGSQTDVGTSENTVELVFPAGVKAENYNITIVPGYLTVKEREIKVVSASDTKVYDGKELVNNGVTVTGTYVQGEEPNYVFAGTQTNAGESLNAFTVEFPAGVKAENYKVTTEFGTLTVTKAPGPVVYMKQGVVITYGQNLPGQLVDRIEGLVEGHELKVPIDRPSDTTAKPVGEYGNAFGTWGTWGKNITVVCGDEDMTANYEKYSVRRGSYKVVPASAPEVTFANAQARTYGDSLANDFTVNFVEEGYDERYVLEVSGMPTYVEAGSYTFKVVDGQIVAVKDGQDAFAMDYVVYAAKDDNKADIKSNFATVVVSGTWEVAKRDIHLSSSTRTEVYNGKALTADSVMYTSFSKTAEFLDGEKPEYVVTGSQLNVGSSKNMFTCKFPAGVNPDNYNIIPTYGTLTVKPRVVTVVSVDADKTYDAKPLTANTVNVTSALGFVDGDVLGYDFTGTQTEAGSCDNAFTVQFKDAQTAANYDLTTEFGTLTVHLAGVPVVKIKTIEVVYGQEWPQQQLYTVSGLAEGHRMVGFEVYLPEGVNKMPAGTTGELTSYNHGKVKILDANDVDVTDNYSKKSGKPLNRSTGKYTIVAAQAPTVTFANPKSRTYGADLSADYSFDFVEAGYDERYVVEVTGMPTYVPAGSYEFKVVDGQIVAVKNGQDAFAMDYAIYAADDENKEDLKSNFKEVKVEGTWKVAKRTVLFASAGTTRTYDGTPLKVNTIWTIGADFVKGERPKFTMTGSQTNVGSSENTFTFEFAEGVDPDNYDLRYSFGTLTVVPREVTVKSVDASRQYRLQPLTAEEVKITSELGFVDGDVVGYNFTGSQDVPGSSANTFTVQFKDAQAEANYKVTVEYGTLTVNPITGLEITFRDVQKEYDGTPISVPFEKLVMVSPMLIGHKVVFEESEVPTVVDVADSRDYTVSFKIMEGEKDVTAFYKDVTVNPGTFTVTKREGAVVTFADQTKVYDGEALVGEVTAAGLAESQTLKVTTPSITDAGTLKNTAAFTVVDANGKDVTANYADIEVKEGLLIVKQRVIVVTSDSDSKEYDGEALTNDTVTVEGEYVANEEPTYDFSGEVTEPGEVVKNTFAVVFPEGVNADNYAIKKIYGDLEVVKRTGAVVTFADQTRDYDGTPLVGEFTWNDAVLESHKVVVEEPAAITNKGEAVNVASFKVVDEDGKDVTELYYDEIAVEEGTLTINPLAVTVKIVGDQVVIYYTGFELAAQGYEAEYSSELYTDADYTFSGAAEVRATMDSYSNYAMGLKADQFVNINENFDVTFEVTDGYLKIYYDENLSPSRDGETSEGEEPGDDTPIVQPPVVQQPEVEEPEVVEPEGPVTEEPETEEPVVEEPEVEVEVVEDTTPVVSDDLVEIEDEETPLANLKADDGNGPIFWILLAGLFATAALFVFLVVLRRNREEEEQA